MSQESVTIEPMDNSGAAATAAPSSCRPLTLKEIYRNIFVIIGVDSMFGMGCSLLGTVGMTALNYLNASNKQVGIVGGFAFLSIFGTFICPYVSQHFVSKKWFLFTTHLPYIGTWGLMALVLLFYTRLGWSREQALFCMIALNLSNTFFGGFVTLPHQEYIAACIPMSHRGRQNAWGGGIGAAIALSTSGLGIWIFSHLEKPLSYVWMYLIAWALCQTAYVLIFLGKERHVPIENVPTPWGKAMLRAVWVNKPFLKMMLANTFFLIFIYPVMMSFMGFFALRGLKLPDSIVPFLLMVGYVARIAAAIPIDWLTNRLHPKRMIPFWAVFGAASMAPLFLMPNRWGVYVGQAMFSIFYIGITTAFNPLILGLPKPEHRAGHYAVQMIQASIGSTIGPAMVGWMCDALDYRMTFILLAVASAVLAPVSWYLLAGLSDKMEDYG